jgi:hypothetical protein
VTRAERRRTAADIAATLNVPFRVAFTAVSRNVHVTAIARALEVVNLEERPRAFIAAVNALAWERR